MVDWFELRARSDDRINNNIMQIIHSYRLLLLLLLLLVFLCVVARSLFLLLALTKEVRSSYAYCINNIFKEIFVVYFSMKNKTAKIVLKFSFSINFDVDVPNNSSITT